MTLTKRLYRIDEVRAAFLYCLRSRRLSEAMFWLHELEESLYGGEARRLFFVAWFLFVGLSNLSWIEAWSLEGNTVAGRRRLCWQFIRLSTRDSSLWWLLVSTPHVSPSSRLAEVWRSKCTLEGEDFWQELVDASTETRIDTILEAFQLDLQRFSLLGKLAGLALLSLQTDKTAWCPLSQNDPGPLLVFDDPENLRRSRLYEIPSLCLYGMSWRGRGADTTFDLHHLSLTTLQSSPYWRHRLTGSVDTSGQWVSEEQMELFWDTHFPWIACDHPDEWSEADRKKSHGEGIDCTRGAPLWRWWKLWIPQEHRWFWGQQKRESWKWVQDQRADEGDIVLQRIVEFYKDLKSIPLPAKKKKVYVFEDLEKAT